MNESHDPAEPATVYIIEDDADLCESVVSLVASKGYRCETFDAAEKFISKPSPTRQPGCILLDFQLSGCDGLSFLKRHREQSNSTPVVVLTAHADVPIAVKFMKAGATMLLKKPYEPSELLEAIDNALAWDRQLTLQRQQFDRYCEGLRQLSKRQATILQLVLEGISNKAVAGQLDVSERTIEMERAEILRIFQVKNAIELAVMITESRMAKDNPLAATSTASAATITSEIASPHLSKKLSASPQSVAND